VVEQLRQKFPDSPVLLLDSGNFSANPTPSGIVKTEALIAGMGRLGYAAANVGERDVRAGYDAFLDRTRGARFPLVSANIVRSDNKKPVLPPSLVVEAMAPNGKRSVRIGLIGVVRFNPIFRKAGPEGTRLEIIHPNEVIGRELKRLREENVELVILLAALHRDDARRIVKEHPGIDIVVGSYGGFYVTEQEEEGSWVLYSGNQGKQLGESRIFLGEGGRRPEVVNKLHYLSDLYPTDPAMREFISGVMRDADRGRTEMPDRPYAGPSACMQCHPAAHGQWASTPHARALAALKAEKDRESPDCLKCHTTGFGRDGGFESAGATPALANVGCESCHGPGRDHIAGPRKGYGKVGIRTCQSCHDVENSPDFDYYSYLTRVVHRDRAGR
jgi:hypothetical protein